jgi:hypothetical protein
MTTRITVLVTEETPPGQVTEVAQEIDKATGETANVVDVLHGPGAIIVEVQDGAQDQVQKLLDDHPAIRNDARGVQERKADAAQ